MKKLIALLLALAMVFALCACGDSNVDNTGSGDPASTGNNESPAPTDSENPPAVELAGTMTQVVTVTLLGNDIPVTLVRNFESGAYRIDYQFNGNDVYAEGYVLEDGTWEIVNTNNDFTFGTIEEVIPAIDDSAWAAAGSELIVTAPAVDPEPTTDPEPAVDPDPVDPNAESVCQTVTVDMMGNATEVYVVKTGNHFEMSYTAMGNDVVLTGSISGDTWTFETSNVEAVAAFAGNIVNSVVAAIDDSAWVSVEAPAAEALCQTVIVDMMGNATEVYVVKTGNRFEMNYAAMGNDVVLTGSIDGDAWIFESSNVEAVAAFAGNIVNSVVAVIDDAAWVPVG